MSAREIYKTDFITISCRERDQDFAADIAENLKKNIDSFQMKIGQYPELPVNIYVASDENDYADLTAGSSELIEFSQAFYHTRKDTVYIRNPRNLRNFSQLHRILLHEYIHRFVRHYLVAPPLWFNEGMAVFFSRDLSIDREFNFIINYIMGNSRKLEEMRYRYPDNRVEWESFYAKSGLAVKYLYNKKRRQFYLFWERAGRDREFNSVFTRSFQMTPAEFSIYFEDYSKAHFRMEILLASTGLIWSILPLVLVIGAVRKSIRNRKIRRQWESEEPYEEISFQEEE